MTTLNLNKAAVARIEYDEAALDRHIEGVISKLSELGVEPPTYDQPPPDDISKLERDIDVLTDRELGNLHVKLVSYLSFLTFQTMVQKVRYEAATHFCKNFKERLQLDLSTKNVAKSSWGPIVAGNEMYATMEQRAYTEKYRYELLKGRLDGVEAQANAISRLITARGQESNALGRSNSSGSRFTKLPSPGRRG